MSKDEVLAEIAKMQTEYPELARLTAPTIDMTVIEAKANSDDEASGSSPVAATEV
jgi:hypothetical protein